MQLTETLDQDLETLLHYFDSTLDECNQQFESGVKRLDETTARINELDQKIKEEEDALAALKKEYEEKGGDDAFLAAIRGYVDNGAVAEWANKLESLLN